MAMYLDFQSAAFMNHALAQGVPARDLVDRPEEYATRFGAALSEEQVSNIRQFGNLGERSGVKRFSPQSQRFVRHVVADGRYLLDWQSKPEEVAERLNYEISPEVVVEVRGAELEDIIGSSDPAALRGLGIASFIIAVVVAAADVGPTDATIIDFSNIQKL